MPKDTQSLSLTLERLWQFSLQYYSVRQVKEACLSLQNQYQGNVNLLLLLKWLDEQKLAFGQDDWHPIQDCLIRSENLLVNYRELRRKSKSHLPDTLYRETLQFELLLEKQQQSDLVDCINGLTLSKNTGDSMVATYCSYLQADHLIQFFEETSSAG
ncbi:TIGR02444 family protein [Vibrio nigripulchritudo]|uniref:TIGR02444 family protein n=1 Tax=Vibrio nigripulchritudo TaxID=28173 RepID=UPI0024932A21|nr:TIGR02444 family protein [Vibrio nigripulchritudo]BDU35810.1 TIGR02444 family protein [Vibrio nigripulchritudo]BDU41480.1 TIGR02444 family protein [Vibrio nigripulchritudo]